jgi:hypothetical protein
VQNNSTTLFVIQTTKGRKNLENINKSINKRELKKGGKELHVATDFLFSPHRFSFQYRKEDRPMQN